jgi:methylmalonyl-CoA epimerase
MIKGIDHVAIAVEDIEAAIALFQNILGLKVTHREDIADYGVRIATIATGGTDVELVQGTSPDSPITRFIASRGAGMHHIAFEVDDIEKALAGMKQRGVELIDQTPRPGKQGSCVAFIHPRATGRVLCELVENRR